MGFYLCLRAAEQVGKSSFISTVIARHFPERVSGNACIHVLVRGGMDIEATGTERPLPPLRYVIVNVKG